MSQALIGEILVDKGYISPAELELGLAHQTATGKRLGESLIELGLISADQLNDALGEKFSIPVIDLTPDMLSDELWNSIPRSFIIEYGIIPIFKEEGVLHVVTSDPTSTEFKEKLEKVVGCRVDVSLADASVIRSLINRWLSGASAETDEAASISSGLRKIIDVGAVEVVALTGTLSAGTYFRTGKHFQSIDISPVYLEKWCRKRNRLPDEYAGHAWTVIRNGDMMIPAQMTFSPVQEGVRLSIRLGREMLQREPFVMPDAAELRNRIEDGTWVVLCGRDPWLLKLAVDLLPDEPFDPAGWLAVSVPGVPVPGEIPVIALSGNSTDNCIFPDFYGAIHTGSGLLVSTPGLMTPLALDDLVYLNQQGIGIISTWIAPGPYSFMEAIGDRMTRELMVVAITRVRRLCNRCRKPAPPSEKKILTGSIRSGDIFTNTGCRRCRGGARGTFSFIEVLHRKGNEWFTESGEKYPLSGGKDWRDFPDGTTPVMCSEKVNDIPLWDLLMIQNGWMITGTEGDEAHATG